MLVISTVLEDLGLEELITLYFLLIVKIPCSSGRTI